MIRVHRGVAINHDLLVKQERYARGENVAARGLGAFFDPTVYTTSAVGIVATSIKKVIDNEQKKYQAQYIFKIESSHWHRLQNDSTYFYNDVSTVGSFDPTGMQFTGFTILRMSRRDTAMKAVFELDTSNLCEIYHDGVFRLKLKELELNYAKAKIPSNAKNKINLDFQIQFMASYITPTGQMNSNVVLGNFSLTLPGVTVQSKESCRRYAGMPLNGWSFIVPRSYGYSRSADGSVSPVYNQGAYTINVTVKETSKSKYVTKLLADESGTVIDATQKGVIFKAVTGSGSGGGSGSSSGGGKKK